MVVAGPFEEWSPVVPDDQSLTDAIAELESRRYSAMLAGDVDVLDRLLSDRLVYGHTRGDRDTKAEYLAKLANGRLVYELIEHSIERISLTDDAAVVFGLMTARARADERVVQMHNTCMVVWAREGGHWRLIGYQATPLVS